MPQPITPLRYREVEMTTDVRVPTFLAADSTYTLFLLRQLLRGGRTTHIIYEPGDMTTYRLVLAPFVLGTGQTGLVVTNIANGGNKVFAGVLWDWDEGSSQHQIEEVARYISRGNEWSEELFVWWLRSLCTRDDR